MLEHLVQNWIVRKPVARSRGGIVATQNRVAGEAGAKILAAGGNAVDAAGATGFALDPADYPVGGGGITTRDLFTWPTVKDDRNVHGPLSIAVPGHADGLGLA